VKGRPEAAFLFAKGMFKIPEFYRSKIRRSLA
jgi:hypothetical protein